MVAVGDDERNAAVHDGLHELLDRLPHHVAGARKVALIFEATHILRVGGFLCALIEAFLLTHRGLRRLRHLREPLERVAEEVHGLTPHADDAVKRIIPTALAICGTVSGMISSDLIASEHHKIGTRGIARRRDEFDGVSAHLGAVLDVGELQHAEFAGIMELQTSQSCRNRERAIALLRCLLRHHCGISAMRINRNAHAPSIRPRMAPASATTVSKSNHRPDIRPQASTPQIARVAEDGG